MRKNEKITTSLIVDIVLLILLHEFIGLYLESVKLKFFMFAFELALVNLIAIVLFIAFFTAKAFNKNNL